MAAPGLGGSAGGGIGPDDDETPSVGDDRSLLPRPVSALVTAVVGDSSGRAEEAAATIASTRSGRALEVLEVAPRAARWADDMRNEAAI